MSKSHKKQIWIDLDNSPHVPFFTPIKEELQKKGYPVTITARDCSQTCGLADTYRLKYRRIGKHYGKNKILKMLGLMIRATQLMPTIIRERPIVALSHGSRAQLLSALLFKIPTLVIADYEHVKMIGIFQPAWMIVPELISSVYKRDRLLTYPGIKEDVYVPAFRPSIDVRPQLAISENELMVTVRPPATEAHYHNPASEELFKAAIHFLGHAQNTRIVILPRNDKQRTEINHLWPVWRSNQKLIIPERVVNGLDLMWHSDLVISGGGTMNREAAALGVPVYSIFCGKIGGVDRYLSQTGRLVLIQNANEIGTKIVLKHRTKSQLPEYRSTHTLETIVNHIDNIINGL